MAHFSFVLCRSFVLDLQKRLPGDRVSGTISFSVTYSFQEEGSEVRVPPQVPCDIPKHVELRASMSQDSCISVDEDHTPLISLHATSGRDDVDSQPDDIIPIVMETTSRGLPGGADTPTSPLEATPTSLSDAADSKATPPSLLGRQASDPIHPRFIRQVLYGSAQKVGPDSRGSSLQRHRSMFTTRGRGHSTEQSHDQSTHHASSVLVKGIHSQPASALPPSQYYIGSFILPELTCVCVCVCVCVLCLCVRYVCVCVCVHMTNLQTGRADKILPGIRSTTTMTGRRCSWSHPQQVQTSHRCFRTSWPGTYMHVSM